MAFVDLYARIIPKNHNVFFVRPGKDYHLYMQIVQKSTILADLPQLDLEPGVPFAAQPMLLNKLHRSRAIRKWYRERSEDRGDYPSLDLSKYPDKIQDLGISQLRAVVERYFSTSHKGDLVVVVPGSFISDAYIGELAGNPSDITVLKFDHLYDGLPLYGRKVNWLARCPKKTLDNAILEIVAKPNAFVLLPEGVRRNIYRLAYPGFVHGDETNARFDVTKEEFTSYDDFVIQAFFNFVASNTRAVTLGEPVDKFNVAAFRDASEFTPDLSTDVSSPGFLNLSSLRYAPLVAAALYAVAVNIGPSAQPMAEAGKLRIGNSLASPDDQCVAEVEKLAVAQLVLLGADGWAEACEKAIRASERNGLKGPARVKR